MAALSLYQHEDGNLLRRRAVFPTGLLGCIGWGGAVIALLSLFAAPTLSHWALGTPTFSWGVRLVLITSLAEVVFGLGILFHQVRLDSTTYVLIILARFLVGIGMNYFFLVNLQKGLWGILFANLLHTGLFAIGTAAFVLWKEGFHFEFDLWKEMLRLGLPLLPGGVLMFMLNNADRYVMQSYRGPTELGLYALGYKIGKLGITFVLAPFLKVWGAVMVRTAHEENGAQKIASVATSFTILYLAFGLALCLSASAILHILAPSSYWSAADIVTPVYLAHLFYAYSTMADTAFYVAKKTRVKPFLMAAGAIASVAMYFLLIPRWGAWGGAYATLIGFVVLAAVSWIVAERYLPVPYEYARMSCLIAVACGIYALARLASAPSAVYGGIIAACVAPLLFLGIIATSPLANKAEREFLFSFGKKLTLRRAQEEVAATASTEF